jgi:hypothetical protein
MARIAAGVDPLPVEAAARLDEFQVAADLVTEAFPHVIGGSVSDDEAAELEAAWEATVAAADAFRGALPPSRERKQSLASD